MDEGCEIRGVFGAEVAKAEGCRKCGFGDGSGRVTSPCSHRVWVWLSCPEGRMVPGRCRVPPGCLDCGEEDEG